LRRSDDLRSAPLLAASIFVDVLNVFLLFLRSSGAASNTLLPASRRVDDDGISLV
jgi:hypothetical protein